MPHSSAAQHERGITYRRLSHTIQLVELWRRGDTEPVIQAFVDAARGSTNVSHAAH